MMGPILTMALFHTMEVIGVHQLFGYPYSSKYLIFGFSRRNKFIQVCNTLKVNK